MHSREIKSFSGTDFEMGFSRNEIMMEIFMVSFLNSWKIGAMKIIVIIGPWNNKFASVGAW